MPRKPWTLKRSIETWDELGEAAAVVMAGFVYLGSSSPELLVKFLPMWGFLDGSLYLARFFAPPSVQKETTLINIETITVSNVLFSLFISMPELFLCPTPLLKAWVDENPNYNSISLTLPYTGFAIKAAFNLVTSIMELRNLNARLKEYDDRGGPPSAHQQIDRFNHSRHPESVDPNFTSANAIPQEKYLATLQKEITTANKKILTNILDLAGWIALAFAGGSPLGWTCIAIAATIKIGYTIYQNIPSPSSVGMFALNTNDAATKQTNTHTQAAKARASF